MRTGSPGQLLVWTDVDPAFEPDFNRWYDREHMAERVAIPGFRWARRYRAASSPRYLALYRTDNLGVFTSVAYRHAFANQSLWSTTNFARMRNPIRRVGAIEIERGAGTGSALGVVTFPAGPVDVSALDRLLGNAFTIDGVLSGHVMVPDAALSTPLPNETTHDRRLDPVLILDATSEAAAERAMELAARELGTKVEDVAILSLLWELHAPEQRITGATETPS